MPSMQMTARTLSLMGAGLFGVSAAFFLGRMELLTDDTGVEVACILLFTFILGFWVPKRAWLASLLGLSVPIAELMYGHATGLTLIAVFVFAMGVIGSGSGFLLRKSIP